MCPGEKVRWGGVEGGNSAHWWRKWDNFGRRKWDVWGRRWVIWGHRMGLSVERKPMACRK